MFPTDIWLIILSYLDDTDDIWSISNALSDSKHIIGKFLDKKIRIEYSNNVLGIELNPEPEFFDQWSGQYSIEFVEVGRKHDEYDSTDYFQMKLEIVGQYFCDIDITHYEGCPWIVLTKGSLTRSHAETLVHANCSDRCKMETDRYKRTIDKNTEYISIDEMFEDFGRDYYCLAEDQRIVKAFRQCFDKYYDAYFSKFDKIF